MAGVSTRDWLRRRMRRMRTSRVRSCEGVRWFHWPFMGAGGVNVWGVECDALML